MLKLERKYYTKEITAIVGVDEAGRGPLAGPVYAAAVVFPKGYKNKEIDDSKKLSPKKREELFEVIKKHALGYGIASVSADEIDRLNIYEATKVCMKAAIAQISCSYQLIITDAMPLQGCKTPVVPIIKGDAQCLNVAAASILAKVSRDRYMAELEKQYPNYKFSVHKGYGTALHLQELSQFGPIPHVHRKTFGPVAAYYDQQIKLF
ncbi:MAG: Ribonuclease HII [Tenericutes bacterium ADurb.BinA155]|jgi:ribonuclease HII|nr:MAG: Ribonuclease HII [Tenericutes bacterium ADurb.BinA155]